MLKLLCRSQEELLHPYLTERILQNIIRGQMNKFECHDQVNLMTFNWYDIANQNRKPLQIIIYFSKDDLFFICENEACLNYVKKLAKDGLSNEKILYNFFTELIKGDITYVEKLEERITDTEDRLITHSGEECTGKIIAFRRELLQLKKYYEQLNEIFEGLMENENNLIPREDLRYFRILNNKIDRLYSHILNLRDYVTQVREAYQAEIDIEQNKLMKIFTVVTAVFLPLTLLVGWYGMNLKMPEFTWDYTYPCVIGASAAVVVFCILYFRRRKWL